MKKNIVRPAVCWLALLLPVALLGGAYISQYVFGLYPCEMCWWQRYPHMVAIVLALLAFALRQGSSGALLVRLAAFAVLISGLIGAFHAGVEYGWWEGFTSCTSQTSLGNDPLAAIMNAPVIRCDFATWTLFGISLAGFNFLISTAGALVILVLSGRTSRRKSGL